MIKTDANVTPKKLLLRDQRAHIHDWRRVMTKRLMKMNVNVKMMKTDQEKCLLFSPSRALETAMAFPRSSTFRKGVGKRGKRVKRDPAGGNLNFHLERKRREL